MNVNDCKVGQWIQHTRTGKPYIIKGVYSGYISVSGLTKKAGNISSSLTYIYQGDLNAYYVFCEDPRKTTELTMNTKTLYSFEHEGVTKYGTHIGINSSNQYLIEEKGTGAIHVLDKKDLEEVLPYTFSVKYAIGSTNGMPTDFIGTPGTVKEGDLLVFENRSMLQMCKVEKVDTKCKTAQAKFKGRKILTEEI